MQRCRVRVKVTAVAVALVLTGCRIVLEAEPEVVGTPPGVADAEIPDAEPLELGPDADRSPVGSLGWALLSPEIPEVVLELATAADARLPEPALDALEAALGTYGGKDVRREDGPSLPAQDVYAAEDLLEFATTDRATASGDAQVAVFAMSLPGRFEAEAVSGVALTATAFAVFPEAIAERLPAGAAVDAFVEAAAVHELGHLFGLVNLTGEGDFHEDPEAPGHTANADSVMHWAVERIDAVDVFTEGPPAEFTEDDREEMARIRDQRP